MGFENNKITAPIDLADVAKALGVSKEDIGYLCTSDKVKPWAKFKPIKVAGVETPTNHWTGGNGKCGFNIPLQGLTTGTLNKESFVALFTADGVNSWTYDQPTDGDWLRITDFEGYYALATAPYGRVYDISVDKDQTSIISIVPIANASTNDKILKLSDFGVFFDSNRNEALYHFGAFLVGNNGGEQQYKRVISNYISIEGKPVIGSTVDIPISDLPVGTYTIYCILASAPIGYDSETGLADIDIAISAVPCPCVPPAILTIKTAQPVLSYDYTLTGDASGGENVVTSTLQFNNNGYEDIEVQIVEFYYLPTGSWDDAVKGTTYVSVAVPAKSSIELIGSHTFTGSDDGSLIGVRLMINGVWEQKTAFFVRPIN